jgi:hypothetical protein
VDAVDVVDALHPHLLKLDAVHPVPTKTGCTHPVSFKLDIVDIETVKSQCRRRPSAEAEMFPPNLAANIDQKFIS